MNVFKNIFSKKDTLNEENKRGTLWNTIQTERDLDFLTKASLNKPQVIFKHSTRCGISKMVYKAFDKDIHNLNHSQVDFYYLDLLAFRGLSQLIASKFNVIHESPQLILIKDATAVYHTSHSDISLKELNKHLDK